MTELLVLVPIILIKIDKPKVLLCLFIKKTIFTTHGSADNKRN